MADPFTQVILKLDQLGFFTFIMPYILTSALFYGLLRKSQIFGEADKSVVVNGVVSIVAAFMILAYPILQGVDIKAQYSAFFAQSVIAILGVMVSIMISGMFFPPDLPKILSEKFKGGGFWAVVMVGGLFVGIAILFTSGLFSVFFPTGIGIATIPQDILLTVGVLVILVISAMALMFLSGAGKKE